MEPPGASWGQFTLAGASSDFPTQVETYWSPLSQKSQVEGVGGREPRSLGANFSPKYQFYMLATLLKSLGIFFCHSVGLVMSMALGRDSEYMGEKTLAHSEGYTLGI